MTLADVLRACEGLDVRRWRASPGADIYPPKDPSERRVIAWERLGKWVADVERRDAFAWEIEKSLELASPDDLRSILSGLEFFSPADELEDDTPTAPYVWRPRCFTDCPNYGTPGSGACDECTTPTDEDCDP